MKKMLRHIFGVPRARNALIPALAAVLLTAGLCGCNDDVAPTGTTGHTAPPATTVATEPATVHAHNYASKVVEATCEAGGYTMFTCECGDSYRGDETDPLEHSFVDETVTPTCTTGGYTLHYCSACLYEVRTDETAELGHTWSDWEITLDATTVSVGERQRSCTACGEVETEEIPMVQETPHVHTYNGEVVAATCTTGGYTRYRCECGDAYEGNTTEPLGHHFSMYRQNGDATCTEDGTKTAKCDRECGEVITVVDEGSAKGHSYRAAVTKPTCTQDGYTVYTCTVCKDSYQGDETAALDHSFGNWRITRNPTCVSSGKEQRVCSRCYTIENREVPAQGHYYEAVETAPTCTEKGYTTQRCVTCGDSYKCDYVKALGHAFGDWYVLADPTCTEDGEECRDCSRCADTETRVLPATGHNYASTVTESSCLEGGYTTHTCSGCGNSYKDSYTSAKGHTWSDWETIKAPTVEEEGVQERVCTACGAAEAQTLDKLPEEHIHGYTAKIISPTCTEQGFTQFTCSCGDSFKEDYVDALGHSYVKYVTEATCTEDGQVSYICSSCGDSYVGNSTAAKGHSYQSVVIAATCTTDGYTTYTCQACGDTYEDSLVAALGHNYEIETVVATCTTAGYTTKTCKNCNDSSTTDLPAMGHNWSEWETTKESTSTEEGEKARTCKNCDATETETIPKVEENHKHTYVDTVFPVTCTEDGYTLRICTGCGKFFKGQFVYAEGHNWSEWVVTEEPTTSSLGEERRTCSTCGEVDVIAIPQLDADGNAYESYIDPRVERETFPYYIAYRFNQIKVLDYRTWGAPPSIWVNDDGSLTVAYYNKSGDWVEVDLELPPDGYIRGLNIREDGTCSFSLVGSFS